MWETEEAYFWLSAGRRARKVPLGFVNGSGVFNLCGVYVLRMYTDWIEDVNN